MSGTPSTGAPAVTGNAAGSTTDAWGASNNRSADGERRSLEHLAECRRTQGGRACCYALRDGKMTLAEGCNVKGRSDDREADRGKDVLLTDCRGADRERGRRERGRRECVLLTDRRGANLQAWQCQAYGREHVRLLDRGGADRRQRDRESRRRQDVLLSEGRDAEDWLAGHQRHERQHARLAEHDRGVGRRDDSDADAGEDMLLSERADGDRGVVARLAAVSVFVSAGVPSTGAGDTKLTAVRTFLSAGVPMLGATMAIDVAVMTRP